MLCPVDLLRLREFGRVVVGMECRASGRVSSPTELQLGLVSRLRCFWMRVVRVSRHEAGGVGCLGLRRKFGILLFWFCRLGFACGGGAVIAVIESVGINVDD